MNFNRLILSLTAGIRHPRVRLVGMVLAAAIFCGGLLIAVRSLPWDTHSLNWGYFVLLILLGGASTLILNVASFYISANAVRSNISKKNAIRLVVLSSAANFLPLPGGILVRVTALKMAGSNYRNAILITGYAGLFWLAVALLVVGIGLAHLLAVHSYLLIAIVGTLLGIFSFIGALEISRAKRLIYRLFNIALVTHLVASFRFWIAFAMVGVDASIVESAVVSGSGTAGSIVAIIPGGFGINEAAAALLTHLTGHLAASGFLAAAFNRLADYIFRGAIAFIFICFDQHSPKSHRDTR